MNESLITERLNIALEKARTGRFQEVERIVDLLLNSDLPGFIGDAGDDVAGRAAKHRAEAVAGLLCGINAALNSKDAQVYADLIDRALYAWRKPTM
jgi:hypothetical protein